MKTISIVSKREALKIQTDTLFHPLPGNRTAYVERYDMGKYKWTGSAKDYIGNRETVADHILALYVERREDSNGPYAAVFCVAAPDPD